MKQVLIIDDDLGNRELLCLALESNDCQIHQADSAKSTMDLVESNEFNVAIVDIDLPDTNGLTLARRLRHRSSSMIIVMASALDEASVMKTASNAGANVYIVKPFEMLKVLDVFQKIEEGSITSSTKMRVVKN